MSKQRILITTHSFYPDNTPRAFRAYELYKELVKKKYEVDVIIGSNKKVIWHETRENYFIQLNKAQSVSSKTSYNPIKEKLKSLIRYFIGEHFIFTHKGFFDKNINLNKYDCVISIGTPFYVHMAVAEKLRKTENEITSISDNGDPFFNYKGNNKAFYFKYIKKSVFKQFDFVCTPIQEAVKYYSQYVDNTKIKVIPQGFDFESVELINYTKNDIPTFAFAGRFYKDIRNPESFLEFLTTLNFNFKFVLYTPNKGEIYNNIVLKYKEILGEKLEIYNFIPRDECIYRLSGVDFLVNFENISSVQSPSKLIDYALSKRPILSFKQNNIPKESFIKFINGNYQDQYNVKDISYYDIKNVSEKFIELIKTKKQV